MIIAFHKPYGVLSAFTPDGSKNRTLAEFGLPKKVYPVGRLDADSEGLLLLSDEADLITRLLEPGKHPRSYHVLVERIPDWEALKNLRQGVELQGEMTLPCKVKILDPQPEYSARVPAVRYRKSVKDVWMELELLEGRNRQVRKMTAAVGHPTLRLIRVRIAACQLGQLARGQWREVQRTEIFVESGGTAS